MGSLHSVDISKRVGLEQNCRTEEKRKRKVTVGRYFKHTKIKFVSSKSHFSLPKDDFILHALIFNNENYYPEYTGAFLKCFGLDSMNAEKVRGARLSLSDISYKSM